jgi:hypothetical protein
VVKDQYVFYVDVVATLLLKHTVYGTMGIHVDVWSHFQLFVRTLGLVDLEFLELLPGILNDYKCLIMHNKSPNKINAQFQSLSE